MKKIILVIKSFIIFSHNNKSKSERLNVTIIFAHTIDNVLTTLVKIMLTYFITLCIRNFVMAQSNLRSLHTLL